MFEKYGIKAYHFATPPQRETHNDVQIEGEDPYTEVNDYIKQYISYLEDSFIAALINIVKNGSDKETDKAYQAARKRYTDFYLFAKTHAKKNNELSYASDYSKYKIPSNWKAEELNEQTVPNSYMRELFKYYRVVQDYDFRFTVSEGYNRFVKEFNELFFLLYHVCLVIFIIKGSDDDKLIQKVFTLHNKKKMSFMDMYNRCIDLLDTIYKTKGGMSYADLVRLKIKGTEKPSEAKETIDVEKKAAEVAETSNTDDKASENTNNTDENKENENNTSKDDKDGLFGWYKKIKKVFLDYDRRIAEKHDLVTDYKQNYEIHVSSPAYKFCKKIFEKDFDYKNFDNYRDDKNKEMNNLYFYNDIFRERNRKNSEPDLDRYAYNFKTDDLKEHENNKLSRKENRSQRKENRNARLSANKLIKTVESSTLDKLKAHWAVDDIGIEQKWKDLAERIWCIVYLIVTGTELASDSDWLTEMRLYFTNNSELTGTALGNKMFDVNFDAGEHKDPSFKVINSNYTTLFTESDNDRFEGRLWGAVKENETLWYYLVLMSRAYDNKVISRRFVNERLSQIQNLGHEDKLEKSETPYNPTKGLHALENVFADRFKIYRKDHEINRDELETAERAFCLYSLSAGNVSNDSRWNEGGWKRSNFPYSDSRAISKTIAWKESEKIFVNLGRVLAPWVKSHA